MFSLAMNANANGTSLRGYIRASYAELAKLFGEADSADGCKVSSEWKFSGPSGQVVTLYDYKETSLYDSGLPTVEEFRAFSAHDWHVGAVEGRDALAFIAWLSGKLKR
jgi:hypothetical protein